MKVFVLVHQFEYQTSVTAHETRAAAEAHGKRIAKEDCPDLEDQMPSGYSDADLIKRYTERDGDGSLEIHETELLPEASPEKPGPGL